MLVLFNNNQVKTGAYSAADPHIIHGFATLESGDSLKFETTFNTDFKVDIKLTDSAGNPGPIIPSQECSSSQDMVEIKIP